VYIGFCIYYFRSYSLGVGGLLLNPFYIWENDPYISIVSSDSRFAYANCKVVKSICPMTCTSSENARYEKSPLYRGFFEEIYFSTLFKRKCSFFKDIYSIYIFPRKAKDFVYKMINSWIYGKIDNTYEKIRIYTVLHMLYIDIGICLGEIFGVYRSFYILHSPLLSGEGFIP
jgi:hypothetical protein